VIDLFKTGRPEPIIQAHRDNPEAVVCAQNARFDQMFLLYHYDLELLKVFDTFRASQIMHNGRRMGSGGMGGHNLYDIYQRELGIQPEAPDLGGSDWSANELTKDQLDYAAEDVVHLPKIREVMLPKLTKLGLNKIMLIECQAILPEAAVMLNGFYLDQKPFRELMANTKIEHDRIQKELWRGLPRPTKQMVLPGFGEACEQWNLDSNQQMLAALHQMGITQQLKIEDPPTADGRRHFHTVTVPLINTSDINLAMAGDQDEVLEKIQKYRETATRLKMFPVVDGKTKSYLHWINETTGRIHPNYWPFSSTGRYNCDHPNLSQVPREKRFRACFRAEDGNKLVIADYSAVEMRVAAEVSGDETLIGVFHSGEDPHYYTAGVLTGKDKKDITKEERQKAKAFNFGLCVAEGQRVLTSEGLIPIEQVQDWHLVWDGVEWVSHEGVVYMGVREVMTYDSVTTTPDHEVYTDDGHKIQMREAASSIHPRRLAVGAVGEAPVRYTAFDRQNKPGTRQDWDWEEKKDTGVRAGNMYGMSRDKMGVSRKLYSGACYGVQVPTKPEVWWRPESRHAGDALRYDDTAMQSGYASEFAQVQGSWNQSSVRVAGGVYSLGVDYVPERRLQREGVRSDRQQRGLRTGESTGDYLLGESTQQGLRRRTAKVYDIRNAGPRHRFTVEGKIVSNCFGMGAEKLVLYARANYGVKLTLKEATQLRNKYFDRFDGLRRWHARAVRDGQNQKAGSRAVRSLWGRLRWLDGDYYTEWLNGPVQSSAADALKRSLRCVYMRLKKLNGEKPPCHTLSNPDPDIKTCHHVHDEQIVEARDKDGLPELVKHELEAGMVDGLQPILPRVPARAEGSVCANWSGK
jgi:DNA polymerase I-like protein with 3'-5' exonuclease and polymerase domains